MFIDKLQTDFITNGQASGRLGHHMQEVHFDSGLMRPWICPDGGRYMDVQTGRMTTNEDGKPVPEVVVVPLQRLIANGMVPQVFNATALPRLVWEKMDTAIVKASRDRLRLWADLRAANTFGGFDGMGVTAISRGTMTDPGSAKVDMDGITQTQGDQAIITYDVVPLPITHTGFHMSARDLAMSRNGNLPFDVSLAEAGSRRIAETIEKMAIGVTDFSSLIIGSSTDFTRRGIYGLITQPDRITKTDLTDISTITEGTSQAALKDDVVEMIKLALDQKFYGPFVLYYSPAYDNIMQSDYWIMSTQGGAAPSKTVRQRLNEIEGISAIRRLDYLTPAATQQLILVQMNSETVRAVVGMEPKTVQWTEQGGQKICISIATIQVPDLRAQYIGTSTSTRKCGIVHGTTA
jgi:hypothetical protein